MFELNIQKAFTKNEWSKPFISRKTTGSICSWWQTALELSNSNHNTGKLGFPTVNLTTPHYPMTMRLSDEIGVHIKNVSFSYCVMKYVSIWKIWANIIQMTKTTCWNEFIESNTKVYSCNYTFGDGRPEKSKVQGQFQLHTEFKPRLGYTRQWFKTEVTKDQIKYKKKWIWNMTFIFVILASDFKWHAGL